MLAPFFDALDSDDVTLRMKAANDLLDRAYGRPHRPAKEATSDTTQIARWDLTALTTPELEELERLTGKVRLVER